VNPTRDEQTVKVPLDEVELELDAEEKHVLTDWSRLERGIAMGSFTIDSAPEIELTPLEVKYIGVNIA
jgi:hypothetical protein